MAIAHRALPANHQAAVSGEAVVAVVERKTLENLATSLSDGGVAFQMQRLAGMATAAIVVEGDYPDLFRAQPGRGSWLTDMLGRLATRYPGVPIVFADSRRFAEEGAYRFLAAAIGDRLESIWSAGTAIPRRPVLFVHVPRRRSFFRAHKRMRPTDVIFRIRIRPDAGREVEKPDDPGDQPRGHRQLFAERGYEATTMADIASASGLSVALGV